MLTVWHGKLSPAYKRLCFYGLLIFYWCSVCLSKSLAYPVSPLSTSICLRCSGSASSSLYNSLARPCTPRIGVRGFVLCYNISASASLHYNVVWRFTQMQEAASYDESFICDWSPQVCRFPAGHEVWTIQHECGKGQLSLHLV